MAGQIIVLFRRRDPSGGSCGAGCSFYFTSPGV